MIMGKISAKERQRRSRHSHDWRFVSASYSKEGGLVKGPRKKCIRCGKTKEVNR